MTFKEAYEYIYSYSGIGIRPGIDRIRRLLALLGDPQEHVPQVHVAGTNGKGSVCNYISGILKEAGFSVGRYISPAVFGYREIIQKDGKWISEDEFGRLIGIIRQVINNDSELSGDRPTPFEIETAAAFLYFSMQKTDIAVVETGMGGKEDATNVISAPIVSVITSIGMDHMNFLGNTIESIAAHKAGIIKLNCPVAAWADDKIALGVIREKCLMCGSALYTVSETDITRYPHLLGEPVRFDYLDYKGLEVTQQGEFEAADAALAVLTCKIIEKRLNERKIPEIISEESIRSGLKDAIWPGRFEVLSSSVPVIIDGAHNPHGVVMLRKSVKNCLGSRSIILVMAVFRDKSHDQMLEIMSDVSNEIIIFSPPGPRGCDINTLETEAKKYFKAVITASGAEEAIHTAAVLAKQSNAAIVQFGTLSVIANSREIWSRELQNKDRQ